MRKFLLFTLAVVLFSCGGDTYYTAPPPEIVEVETIIEVEVPGELEQYLEECIAECRTEKGEVMMYDSEEGKCWCAKYKTKGCSWHEQDDDND